MIWIITGAAILLAIACTWGFVHVWRQLDREYEEVAILSGREIDAMHATLMLPLVVIVISLWLGATLGVIALRGNISEAGPLGDAFGAANALFSGFALAGVIVAIILQTKQIRLQFSDQRQNKRASEMQADAALLETYLAVFRDCEEKQRSDAPPAAITGPIQDVVQPEVLLRVLSPQVRDVLLRFEHRLDHREHCRAVDVHVLAIQRKTRQLDRNESEINAGDLTALRWYASGVQELVNDVPDWEDKQITQIADRLWRAIDAIQPGERLNEQTKSRILDSCSAALESDQLGNP